MPSAAIPTGGQFTVNPTLAPPEYPAKVAVVDSTPGSEEFLTVWQSYGEDGNGFGVFAQVFDKSGNAITGLNRIQVNDTTAGNQEAPVVASDGAGHFIIAWQSENVTTGGYDVFYRTGTLSGTTVSLGTETQVNTLFTDGNQMDPAVAMDTSADPHFVIAWQSEDTSLATPDYDIYEKQGVFSTGLNIGDETRVNSLVTAGDQTAPDVTMGPTAGSDFVITWQGPGATVSETEASIEVYAKLYDSAGTALTADEFQVNVNPERDQVAPVAAMNASGEFVVAWQAEGQQASGSDIYARRFMVNPTPSGPGDVIINLDPDDVHINTTTTGPQRAPAVGIDASGNVMFTWQANHEDNFSWGIFGRRYDATSDSYSSEFQINDVVNQGPQTSPAVATLGDGYTVVTWLGPDVPVPGVEGEGGHVPAIHARIYNNTGATPAGSEVLLQHYKAIEDSPAAAADDANGNYVVVWQSWEDVGDLSSFGIYAKLYQANGHFLDVNGNGLDDDVFLVNNTTQGNQTTPAVAMDNAGDFVVVWQSPDADGTGIFARIYSASQQAWVGSEFQVNVDSTANQSAPAVAMDPTTGDFIVVWEGPDADGTGIFSRRFTVDGTPLSNVDYPVNVKTATNQVEPAVAMNAAGQSIIAWVSDHNKNTTPSDTEKSIFARWYNSSGQPSGTEEFLVNKYVIDAQENPHVAIGKNGNFVVVWQSINQEMNQEGIGSSWGIYARQFDVSTTGVVTPVQDQEFRVNQTVDGSQRFPSVGMDPDGDFAVAWQSIPQDGQSWGVYTRQYSSTGSPVTNEARVNTTTMGPQILPVFGRSRNDDYQIFWSGQGAGHVDGVHGQMFHWITNDFNQGNLPSLGPDWIERIGRFNIFSSQATPITSTALATRTGIVLTDVAVEADFVMGGGLSQNVSVFARYDQSAGTSMYWGGIVNQNGALQAQIWRDLHGQQTLLAQKAVTTGQGRLRFEVAGSSLKLFVNNKLVIYAFDNTISGAGLTGIQGTDGTTIDNFTASPITLNPASLLFNDSFNLTDGSQLSRFWSEHEGNFTDKNNMMEATKPGALSFATANGISAFDVKTQVDFTLTNSGLQSAGLVARYNAATGNMYVGQIIGDNGSFTALIWRRVGGVWTKLVEESAGVTSSGTLRFEVVKSSLKLFLNDTLVASASDSSLNAAGTVGLWFYNNTPTLDNFSADRIQKLPFNDDFSSAVGGQLDPAKWFDVEGNFTVTTGQAQGSSSGLNLAIVNGIQQADVNTHVNFTLTNSGLQSAGLVARYDVTTGDMYVGQIVGDNGSFTALIWRRTAGVWTKLAEQTGVSGNGTLRFEVVQTSLKLFLNNQLVVFAHDGGLSVAGTVGMWAYNNIPTLDNFGAEKITLYRPTLAFNGDFSTPVDEQLNLNWFEESGNFKVATNQAQGNDPNAPSIAVLNGVNAADVSVQAHITLPVTTVPQSAGLVARYAGGLNGNTYLGKIEQSNGTFKAQIWKRINGTWILLKQEIVGSGTGTLKFEVKGSSLKLYLDDVVVASATDTSITTGTLGMWAYATTPFVDNFTATVI